MAETNGMPSSSYRTDSEFLAKPAGVLCDQLPVQLTGVHPTAARKKKARPREKDFDELYVETGEILGQGAFGDVRTYRHIETAVEYAIKLVSMSKKRSRAKVLREIEILVHCRQHPNIVNISQFFEKPNMMIIVFEKLYGGTLIDNAWSREVLTEEDISQVVRNIASGLDFLHKLGVAHRDLKPDNILCVSREHLVPLKLIDFDLASDLVVNHNNSSSAFVTTPRLSSPVGSTEFMAPEVVQMWQPGSRSRCSYDKRCDLWSLGVILYLLLCGYMPFREVKCSNSNCQWSRGKKCEECQNLTFELIEKGKYSFPEAEWKSVSLEAKELVAKLLVKNPWSRFLTSDVLHHVWLSDEFAENRSASILMPERDTVENISARIEDITAASRQLDADHCSKSSLASLSALELNSNDTPLHIGDADIVLSGIERNSISTPPPTTLTTEWDRHSDHPEFRCAAVDEVPDVTDGCSAHGDVHPDEFPSPIVFSPHEDIEDNRRVDDSGGDDDLLLFHMSDLDTEDGGIVDWPDCEADDDASRLVVTSLWFGVMGKDDEEDAACRLRPDEDVDIDSGTGNSVDSDCLLCSTAG